MYTASKMSPSEKSGLNRSETARKTDDFHPSKSDKLIVCDICEGCKQIGQNVVDLAYLDPPYYTQRDYKMTARQSSANSHYAFQDTWETKEDYLNWLHSAILAIVPTLQTQGSFLLHLDWHIVHYAKVMCDTIFGYENFQNELIWYYQTGGASKGRFSRKHDTILFYSRGKNFYFDGKSIAIPRTPKAMKRAACPTGARIKATDTHKNPDDVLIVSALNPMANERTGYPTQKPLELLERLILALCPPDGLVADFCCGSGTTLVAAKKLKRRYFGCDISEDAVALAQNRLNSEGRLQT